MTETSPFQLRLRNIRDRAADDAVLQLLGAQLGALEPGAATVSVGCRPELVAEEEGCFYEDVTTMLVEQGARIAAATRIGDGEACLATECRLHHLAPAYGERLVCRARVVRAGRLVSVIAADVVCVTGSEEVTTATAIATVSIVEASALAPAGRA